MTDPGPQTCARCGEEILAGRGWIRDSQDRPMHLRCSESRPACAICSKPVLPNTSVADGESRVHVRCVSRQQQLWAIAERDRARQGIARSKKLIMRTRKAMAQAKDETLRCAVCRRPLAMGPSLVFQGDRLVHTSCWRIPGPPPEQSA